MEYNSNKLKVKREKLNSIQPKNKMLCLPDIQESSQIGMANTLTMIFEGLLILGT